ncbi:MAG: heavy-metal-associated domain-containing protein, partial [Desulfobacula sp.]|nr:heavy-metal-associated domain-containing protein [Desulfobacula sp.]
MSEQTLNLPITGMTCANCAANITRTVSKLDGVTNANANFAAENAMVSFDTDKIGSNDIIHKIQDI